MAEVTGAEMRRVLGHFATGVTVITAGTADGPVGMVANSFASVSLEPPLILFCAAHSSETWPEIQAVGKFCVNVLGHRQELLAAQFAKKGSDRYAGVDHLISGHGNPRLAGAIAQIECRVTDEHPAGDHLIVVGGVLEMEIDESESAELHKPLIFYRGDFARL
ncbi:MAG: flavin reductase family protein [Actinobacteria bacterium]|nr:flavin reductase family protein [Actinomycetota bacterium]